ncbi:type III-B CRISPR module RAMP protein Cmr1 [Hahella sp. CCB-MM4]|nr:type III-B CRISPR module RAMP protein Cmr1 [Hahella sp. CCB-MM4]
MDDDPSGQKQPPSWETYHCELKTPLYGGGVEAGVVDEEMPVRATEIRGQLRFWWRIACGPDSPEDMFQQETAIWGGISKKGATASRVEIRVTDYLQVTTEPAFKCNKGNGGAKMKAHSKYGEGYALFPAQGKLTPDKTAVEKAPDKFAIPGLTFKLHIRFHDKLKPSLTEQQKGQVKTALRWWVSFGGVGARTRRGLGALKVEGLQPVTVAEVKSRNGDIRFYRSDNPVQYQVAVQAWKKAIRQLKGFRQYVSKDENSCSSAWPEADWIRNVSGCSLPRHRPNNAYNLFPRAVFGLPIVFHFKDGPDPDSNNNPKRKDPIDHTLEPADVYDASGLKQKYERMASPLILRPYWNGETWQAMALLLPGWQKALNQPLKFRNQEYPESPQHWPEDSAAQRDWAATIAPMKMSSATDPLSAFMDYFGGVK